jgi:hypothetical protein
MTKSAAAVEMSGAKSDQVRIVELRHLDPARVPLHGVPHAEIEETLDEGPVTLAGCDVAQALTKQRRRRLKRPPPQCAAKPRGSAHRSAQRNPLNHDWMRA